MNTGLHYGLSFAEYTAIPAINSSVLKTAASESLAHAKAQIDGKLVRESDALDFGTSFHELLLRDNADFVIRPDAYPAPKGHKTAKEGDLLPWTRAANFCKTWEAENAVGKTVYSQAEADGLASAVAAVRGNSDLQPFLNGDSHYEVCGVAEKTGVLIKSLYDTLPASGPIIDFKSCRSANPANFVK